MIDEKIKAEAERRYPLLTKSDLAEILKIPVGWVYDRELRNANESPNEQRDAFIAGANFGKEMRWVKVSEGLPEDKSECLCYDNKNKKRRILKFRNRLGFFNSRYNLPLPDGDVTHWMPLPPEPGGE